jgi:hypothetical protein
MRKLALLTTLFLAVAIPAIAMAAGDAEAPESSGPPSPASRDRGVQAHVEEAKRKLRVAKRRARPRPQPVAVPAHLQAIAECESGGDPTAIGGGGLYRGKYQFSVATWRAVGGTGDPAAAPEAEQDRRAIVLYETSGPGQWPVCSR